MERVLNGRYRLLEKIGDGGMATVFLAQDLLLDRDVAVKILRDQYAADERFLARFRREAKAAANLSHPNIVSIFDVGDDLDCHYIVMERVEGISLREMLDREGPLSAAKAVRLATQVCSALDYAHSKGLVHRDIKPQNILLVRGDHVKVVDFGIAKGVADSSLTEAGVAMGSVHYLSPEQARGESATPLSDIYSLGVVLYEMTCGRLPFEGDTAVGVALKHIDSEPEAPSAVCSTVPPRLEAIILKAMSKDPAIRFQSGVEFADSLTDFQRFGEEHTIAIPTIRPVRPAQETAQSPAVVVRERRPAPPQKTQPRPVVEQRRKVEAEVVPQRISARPRQPKKGLGCGGALTAGLIVGLLIIMVPFFVWVMPAMGNGFDFSSLFGGGGQASSPTATSSAVANVKMPKLIGLSQQDAEAQLNQLGLKPVVGATQYSDTVPEGEVIDQSVPEGQQVTPGSTVELTVSQGKKTVVIPPLANVTQKDAVAALTDLGVKYDVREEASASVPAGVVIRQSHEGPVPVGTVVTLVVSMGDKMKVPDMFGMPEAQAQQVLKNAGLKTVDPNYQTQKDMPSGVDINIVKPGQVLSASPDFNTWVDRGTVVHLAVRKPNNVGLVDPTNVNLTIPTDQLQQQISNAKKKLKQGVEQIIGD
jgi:eukaryotic-like serine/threonine-protein kinase